MAVKRSISQLSWVVFLIAWTTGSLAAAQQRSVEMDRCLSTASSKLGYLNIQKTRLSDSFKTLSKRKNINLSSTEILKRNLDKLNNHYDSVIVKIDQCAASASTGSTANALTTDLDKLSEIRAELVEAQDWIGSKDKYLAELIEQIKQRPPEELPSETIAEKESKPEQTMSRLERANLRAQQQKEEYNRLLQQRQLEREAERLRLEQERKREVEIQAERARAAREFKPVFIETSSNDVAMHLIYAGDFETVNASSQSIPSLRVSSPHYTAVVMTYVIGRYLVCGDEHFDELVWMPAETARFWLERYGKKYAEHSVTNRSISVDNKMQNRWQQAKRDFGMLNGLSGAGMKSYSMSRLVTENLEYVERLLNTDGCWSDPARQLWKNAVRFSNLYPSIQSEVSSK